MTTTLALAATKLSSKTSALSSSSSSSLRRASQSISQQQTQEQQTQQPHNAETRVIVLNLQAIELMRQEMYDAAAAKLKVAIAQVQQYASSVRQAVRGTYPYEEEDDEEKTKKKHKKKKRTKKKCECECAWDSECQCKREENDKEEEDDDEDNDDHGDDDDDDDDDEHAVQVNAVNLGASPHFFQNYSSSCEYCYEYSTADSDCDTTTHTPQQHFRLFEGGMILLGMEADLCSTFRNETRTLAALCYNLAMIYHLKAFQESQQFSKKQHKVVENFQKALTLYDYILSTKIGDGISNNSLANDNDASTTISKNNNKNNNNHETLLKHVSSHQRQQQQRQQVQQHRGDTLLLLSVVNNRAHIYFYFLQQPHQGHACVQTLRAVLRKTKPWYLAGCDVLPMTLNVLNFGKPEAIMHNNNNNSDGNNNNDKHQPNNQFAYAVG